MEIDQGKTLIIKLISIGQPQQNGKRILYFDLNGQSRELLIDDNSIEVISSMIPIADSTNPNHIAATMPGTVLKVLTSNGNQVKRGDHLLITEAMKMETTVQAPKDGVIKQIYVKAGDGLSVGNLLIEFEA